MPPRTHQFPVLMDPEEIARLRRLSMRDGRTGAEIIRRLLKAEEDRVIALENESGRVRAT